MNVELLKLKMDPHTMNDLELLRTQNSSIVYCTQWHHIPED